MAQFTLRIYVTGGSVNSDRAIKNLRSYCETDSENEYEIDILDVLERPDLAEKDRIMATPTLIRLEPQPERRIVGDLSAREAVCNILGIDPTNKRQSMDDSQMNLGERK